MRHFGSTGPCRQEVRPAGDGVGGSGGRFEAFGSRAAFTLIELLVVVAIIAVLALMALPNLLEAQVRAKAARARADLRHIATALEAYALDHGDYPRNWFYGYGTISPDLTTPVAYLTTNYLFDPFATRLVDPYAYFGDWPQFTQFYTYNRVLPLCEAIKLIPDSPWQPGAEAIDGPAPDYNEGALRKYGQWRLFSLGPDRLWIIGRDLASTDILYDPTNGTVSFGNIIRTQLSPEGHIVWRPAKH